MPVISPLPKPCGLAALHTKWGRVSLSLLALNTVQRVQWHLESSLAAKLRDAHVYGLGGLASFLREGR